MRPGVWRMDQEKGGEGMTAVPLALPIDVEDVGEIRVYKMAFPFVPPSKNAYDGWPNQWKQSAKKKWERAIIAECKSMALPLHVPKVGLAATLVFPARAHRDPQNYAQALWHWVPDALQKAGVIDDDTEGCIEIGANWGLKFAYDIRPTVPKSKRTRTLLAITMRVP